MAVPPSRQDVRHSQKERKSTVACDGNPIPWKRGDRSCLFGFTKESYDSLRGGEDKEGTASPARVLWGVSTYSSHPDMRLNAL